MKNKKNIKKKVDLVIYDKNKNEGRKLIGFTLAPNKNDLYFYDKSNKSIKLSFHKDGSVWFHENKDGRPLKLYDELKAEGLDEDRLFHSFLYFPCSYSKYEISDMEGRPNHVQYLLQHSLSRLNKISILILFSTYPMDYNDIRKKFNITLELPHEIFIKKDDDRKSHQRINNPIYNLGNFRFFLHALENVDRPEVIKGKKMIFLTPPNIALNLGSFKKSALLSIDLNKMKKISIQKDPIIVDGIKVLRIIY